MGMFFTLALTVIKKLAKVALFCGLAWFLLPIAVWGIGEAITGAPMTEGTPLNTVSNILWYACYVLAPLTLIQNLVRMIKKDRSFSWIGLIMNRETKKGIEAKLGGDTVALKTASDLSGVVFGKLGGKYATMPETTDGHILIVGGAGSGKTAAVAIPTLMSWKQRVFAIDIKGELYEKTKKARGEAQIKVFNPTDKNAYGYDPYFMLKTADDVSSAARQLAMSICPLPAEIKDPFWIKGAQNMLTGFMIYLQGLDENFSSSMRIIKSTPTKELIAQILEDTNEKARMEVMQFSDMDDKTLSGVYAELSNHITVFATSDELQKALSGEGRSITPADLENSYDIFCCIPEYKLEEWKDLMGMMCNQFLKSFERRSEGNKTPILFFIDEFPRLGKIEAISNGLATLRSKKIHIALVIQSLSQLNAIYGHDVAKVIADNCSYKAILKASEPDTQEWCSKLVGTYDKMKKSSSWQGDNTGFGKGIGTSSSTEEKRIIKPEEFGFLEKENKVICIFPSGYKMLQKSSCYEIGSPFFEKLPPEVQAETKRRAAEAKAAAK